MAVLSESDRQTLHAEVMRDFSQRTDVIVGALTKAELRAAIDAIDAWVDTNTTSFNTAIPLPARTVMSAKQKARLLVWIIQRRWEVA